MLQNLSRDDITTFFSAFENHDARGLRQLDPGNDIMFFAEVQKFLGFGSGRPIMHGARSASAALLMLPLLVRDLLASMANSPPAAPMPRTPERVWAPQDWTKVRTFHAIQTTWH